MAGAISPVTSSVNGLSQDQLWDRFKALASKSHSFVEIDKGAWDWSIIQQTKSPIIFRQCRDFLSLTDDRFDSLDKKALETIAMEQTNTTSIDAAFGDSTSRVVSLNPYVKYALRSLNDHSALLLKDEVEIQRSHSVTPLHVEPSLKSIYLPKDIGAIKIWVCILASRNTTNQLILNSRFLGQTHPEDLLVAVENVKDFNVDVAITRPGDCIVLRAGDHYSVTTCYLHSNSEQYAMEVGHNFYSLGPDKVDLYHSIRFLTNYKSSHSRQWQQSPYAVKLYKAFCHFFPHMPVVEDGRYLDTILQFARKENLVDPIRSNSGLKARSRKKKQREQLILNLSRKK